MRQSYNAEKNTIIAFGVSIILGIMLMSMFMVWHHQSEEHEIAAELKKSALSFILKNAETVLSGGISTINLLTREIEFGERDLSDRNIHELSKKIIKDNANFSRMVFLDENRSAVVAVSDGWPTPENAGVDDDTMKKISKMRDGTIVFGGGKSKIWIAKKTSLKEKKFVTIGEIASKTFFPTIFSDKFMASSFMEIRLDDTVRVTSGDEEQAGFDKLAKNSDMFPLSVAIAQTRHDEGTNRFQYFWFFLTSGLMILATGILCAGLVFTARKRLSLSEKTKNVFRDAKIRAFRLVYKTQSEKTPIIESLDNNEDPVFPIDGTDHDTAMKIDAFIERARFDMTKNAMMFQVVDKMGKRSWQRLFATTSPLENGGHATDCLLQDVTEKRLVEESLSEEWANHQALIENSGLMFHSYDANGNLAHFNAAYADALGYSKNELLETGPNHPFILSGDIKWDEFSKSQSVSKSPTRFTMKNIDKNGNEVIWETVSYASSFGGKPHITCLSNKAKQSSEDELLHDDGNPENGSQDFFAAAASKYAGDGLFATDTDGHITFINKTACDMLGYFENECLGMNAHDLFHHTKETGEDYPEHECPGRDAAKRGKFVRVDDEVYWRSDGKPVFVSYAVHPILSDGNISGAVTSFMNMEHQRAAMSAKEKALHAAENLAQAKSDFLANMSHEIRTPLHGILGFAKIGEANVGNEDKIRKSFAHILSSANHLSRIVDDILDYAKIEAGKMRLDKNPINVAQLIEETASMISSEADKKGLNLVINKNGTPDIDMIGDLFRIKQILLNLLSNAVKFSDSGQIGIAFSIVEKNVEISVTDTGIGIDEKHLRTLFQPFHQIDSSSTRKRGGTGLGLAISQRLAGLIGGHIKVDSKIGKGSTFTLSVPFTPPSVMPQRKVPLRRDGKPLEGMEILIVDDEPLNIEMLGDVLSGHGARVLSSPSGEEGIDLVKNRVKNGERLPDIVLMDIGMPTMDGLEATRAMLTIAPSLPILGQTAHHEPDDIRRSLEAGMKSHIPKPINVDIMINNIVRFARRS